MLSKIWFINILLAGLAVFFGIKAHDVWINEEKANPEMRVAPGKSGTSFNRPVKRVFYKRMPPESVYDVVAGKNLFSPDRAEFIPEEPEPESEPEVEQISLSGKKITLYGVIIMDDYKSALISNPFPAEPGERKNKWVKEGETVGDFEVAEIQKGRILLAEKGKKYEIPLYGDKPGGNKRIKRAGKPANQGGKAGKPTVVVSESKKSQAASEISKKKPAGSEYEMINTPFGKMRRKKKGKSGVSEKKPSLKDLGVPNFKF
ncbi:hypothetical protein QUF72_11450 [Desulfobacterales bacterium HSG2]|nr:hypothetical protein [Desulfobacterales bacterium HSG2]